MNGAASKRNRWTLPVWLGFNNVYRHIHKINKKYNFCSRNLTKQCLCAESQSIVRLYRSGIQQEQKKAKKKVSVCHMIIECSHLLTSLPATRLLIGQGGLRGRGLAADRVVRGPQAFARLVEVARLGRVQTGVAGFPRLGAGAHLRQRRV